MVRHSLRSRNCGVGSEQIIKTPECLEGDKLKLECVYAHHAKKQHCVSLDDQCDADGKRGEDVLCEVLIYPLWRCGNAPSHCSSSLLRHVRASMPIFIWDEGKILPLRSKFSRSLRCGPERLPRKCRISWPSRWRRDSRSCAGMIGWKPSRDRGWRS